MSTKFIAALFAGLVFSTASLADVDETFHLWIAEKAYESCWGKSGPVDCDPGNVIVESYESFAKYLGFEPWINFPEDGGPSIFVSREDLKTSLSGMAAILGEIIANARIEVKPSKPRSLNEALELGRLNEDQIAEIVRFKFKKRLISGAKNLFWARPQSTFGGSPKVGRASAGGRGVGVVDLMTEAGNLSLRLSGYNNRVMSARISQWTKDHGSEKLGKINAFLEEFGPSVDQATAEIRFPENLKTFINSL